VTAVFGVGPQLCLAVAWVRRGSEFIMDRHRMLTLRLQREKGSVMPKLTSCRSKLYVIAALVALVSLPDARVRAQENSPQQQQSQQQDRQQLLSQKEIQQLVAPIALYPDALLAQVLTASTYPLEVTMAARWSEKNRNVKGEVLQDAMQKQSWDPSVKGLTSVPQVLSMMNNKLDWTSRLGEVFLAQPDDVQKAVQTLRAQAEKAGNLKSTKEQRVRRVAATPSPGYVGPPEYVVIESIEPDYIYVPIYDPTIVFGVSYWEPAYVPFFWYPPWWTVGPVFGFGPALFVGPALWYGFSWGHAGYSAIHVNHAHYSKFNKANYSGGDRWKFDPAHRRMGFKNKDLQQQFGKAGSKALDTKSGQAFEAGKQFKDVQRGKEMKDGQIKEVKGGQSRKSIEGGQKLKGEQGIKIRKSAKGVQKGGGPQFSGGGGPKFSGGGGGPKGGGGGGGGKGK
jgi:uncharacterized membrane protein YgcG